MRAITVVMFAETLGDECGQFGHGGRRRSRPASRATLPHPRTRAGQWLLKHKHRSTFDRSSLQNITFDSKFEFEVGPDEQFLNVCLWCKPPIDCDVPNIDQKFILLGYVSFPRLPQD